MIKLYIFVQFWFYEYFPTCSHSLTQALFLAMYRWAGHFLKPSETLTGYKVTNLNSFRDFINTMTLNSAFSVVSDLTKSRKMFRGPFGYVWYLGERASAQHSMSFLVPTDPPLSMSQLKPPLDLPVIGNLFMDETLFDSLMLEDSDYATFCQTRLAPPALSYEIRTHFVLLEARVRDVDLHMVVTYEEILLFHDPVDGLPFPPDFKRDKSFDRAELEQMCRLLKSSMRRVEDLPNFQNLWPSIPKTATINLSQMASVGLVAGGGPRPLSGVFTELARRFSFNMPSSMGIPASGEGSLCLENEEPRVRKQLRKQRVIIEDESGPKVDEDWGGED